MSSMASNTTEGASLVASPGGDRTKYLTVRSHAVRQKILLQDIDKGARCTTCGDRCPGFSYHVWRKICKHCKCPREAHDIQNLDQFGPSTPRARFLQMDDSKGSFRVQYLPYDPSRPPSSGSSGPRNRPTIKYREHHDFDEKGEYYRAMHGKTGQQEFYDPLEFEQAQERTMQKKVPPPVEEKPKKVPPPVAKKPARKPSEIAAEAAADIEPAETPAAAAATADEEELERAKKAGEGPRYVSTETQTDEMEVPLGSRALSLGPSSQDPDYDHHLELLSLEPTQETLKSFLLFQEKRQRATDEGVPVEDLSASFLATKSDCLGCGKPFVKDDVVIEAKLLGGHLHAECFKCTDCSAQLRTTTYYTHRNHIFCGRCHAEKFLPRCKGCDELIFDQEYIEAEGSFWHNNHFCCWECDLSLGDRQYTKDRTGNPVCLSCCNWYYSKKCTTCRSIIQTGTPTVTVQENYFHNTTACFKCGTCSDSLQKKKCFMLNGKLVGLCCHTPTRESFVCGRCQKSITGAYARVGSRVVHKDCFSCEFSKCKKTFGEGSDEKCFMLNNQMLCREHAICIKLGESLSTLKQTFADAQSTGGTDSDSQAHDTHQLSSSV